MSPRAILSRAGRARVTVATAAAVTAALLTPAQGVATTAPAAAAAAAAAGSDTVDVTGTVRVLAGEDGEPDRYSLLLPSGRTLQLADGFRAEPLSRFTGSLAVPGAGSGRTLAGSVRASTLRRAAVAGTRLEVVDARVAAPAPAPGPAAHATYVAKVTNFGTIGLTDAQILAGVSGAQQYWVRESAGQVPAWTTASAVVPVAAGAGSVAAGCGLGNGGADFDAIAGNVAAQAFPGVDFSGRSPNHLVVVVPDGCGGSVGGRGNLGTSFANGGPVILQAEPGIDFRVVLEHEYGHNVGLQHAGNNVNEYGDVYEVMGAGPMGYPNPVLGTVYRWEQGVVAAGEVVDGTGGGSWTLAPRSASTGLRSVVFIDPDNGRRTFVDYRNGSAGDAGSYYTAGGTGNYGQTYTPGITVEREDDASGAFLHKPAGSNDGALQSGEVWSNASGTLKVAGNGAGVSITRAPAPNGTVAGGAASVIGPMALRDATASVSGFVPAPAGYRYQWTLNGQAIAGAEDRTFRPTTAMAGGALAVIVTAYAPGYDPVSRTSAPQTVAPALWYALPTRRYPEISGSTRVGQTLTAVGLEWVNYYSERPADLAPVYQWSRNGNPIEGATAAAYRLTSKDLGKRIQVSEYPRAAGFDTTELARSVTTPAIRTGRLVTSRPRIGGKAAVGKRVVARAKGWTNGTTFRYQWFVGKRAVRGATGKKLRVTRSMRGKKLVVKVTGKKTGYRKATVTSRPKKVR
ncbi:MAG TPA: hypothetical protein VLK03_01105 [Nocardioides sp.]|nr:hypothetical protein [Nocardioides sp.]